MDTLFDEVIESLNAMGLQNEGWTYKGVFTEVLIRDINDILLIANQTLQVIQKNFGMYGSVNVGTGGLAYTAVRNGLLKIYNLERQFIGANGAVTNEDFSNLLKFLSEPVLKMPEYIPGGPGGQGDSKIVLNGVINVVYQRSYMVQGVLQMKNSAKTWNVEM